MTIGLNPPGIGINLRGWFAFLSSSLIQSLPKEDGRAVTSVNKDLILEDDSLKRKDGAALTIDDCEVFKCPVASIGRQAYGVMSRFGEAGQEIVKKRSISGSSSSNH